MWTLKQFHRVAELTAAIAVVVSLIFVGLEIAQNNQISVEDSTQRLLSESRSIQRALTDDADFACVYVRGISDYLNMSGPDRIQFSAYMVSAFQVYNQMYVLAERERIEPEIWQGVESLLSEMVHHRGIQQWFGTRRHWFGESYQQYIDGLVGRFPAEDVVFYDDSNCVASVL